ncbi:hypothetical protein B0T17DRAFT_525304 [Bombardia bombarda]|uniref:Uncharacterized protein n=1 Tax=Bombardia bombarda TaxID=252184 RepID=A0AA39X8N0_9PEZI|nr:hypothetical protein B0T17DRAFT_525304 [Bombardia bombarda]
MLSRTSFRLWRCLSKACPHRLAPCSTSCRSLRTGRWRELRKKSTRTEPSFRFLL